ncbi:MAG: hypothetical protein JSS75_09335 [Bacteroidetes bacterium]|nr:hypothetical protein [Bacteroidota bacterium]
MNQHSYPHRSLAKRATREKEQQTDMRVTNGDLHFVTDFVRGSAFYIEDLEERIGEDLDDFWQSREHAMRILTDWMMQSMTPTAAVTAKAA